MDVREWMLRSIADADELPGGGTESELAGSLAR